jgi:hypothetical protein
MGGVLSAWRMDAVSWSLTIVAAGIRISREFSEMLQLITDDPLCLLKPGDLGANVVMMCF